MKRGDDMVAGRGLSGIRNMGRRAFTKPISTAGKLCALPLTARWCLAPDSRHARFIWSAGQADFYGFQDQPLAAFG